MNESKRQRFLVDYKTIVTVLSYMNFLKLAQMKGKLKKVLIISISTIFLLAVVLMVHIYWVTTPRIDKNTVAMARIDLSNDVNQKEAEEISAWLYQQSGVQHVLCNDESNTVVFTFFPARANADRITSAFNAHFSFSGQRYKPDLNAMQSGCPVSATTLTGKVSNIFKGFF